MLSGDSSGKPDRALIATVACGQPEGALKKFPIYCYFIFGISAVISADFVQTVIRGSKV